MSKTTIAAVCIAVGTLLGVAGKYLSGGGIDGQTILQAVLGLVTALGFKLAGDQK